MDQEMDFESIPEYLKLLLPLRNPARLKVFFIIAEFPGLRFRELREKTNLDSNDLNNYLTAMRNSFLLSNEGGIYSLTKIGNRTYAILQEIGNDFDTAYTVKTISKIRKNA